MNEETKSGQNKLKIALIVVAALLLLSLIGNIIYMGRSSRLADDKEALRSEVGALEDEKALQNERIATKDGIIDDLNQRMTLLVEEHEEVVREKDVRIAQLNRRANANANDLKAQVEQNKVLQTAKEAMEHDMEALQIELSEARQEMDALAVAYEQLWEQTREAAAMKVYNVFALTKWERWLCADRYHVSKARRVDHSFIRFEVDGTVFTETGSKMIHLLLYNPEGELLYPSASQFTMVETYDTEAGLTQSHYTAVHEINYAHEPVYVEFNIQHDKPLRPGTYLAEIYVDGALKRTHEMTLE